jgi:hypothetical protein
MAAPHLKIVTPRGKITVNQKGTKAELEWNPGMGPEWTGKYDRAQQIMDTTVLRGCDKYVPMKTGMLKKSGILGTEVGSGWVNYIAPYARKRYYTPGKIGSETGPLRGFNWFERWKANEGKAAIDRVRKAFKP